MISRRLALTTTAAAIVAGAATAAAQVGELPQTNVKGVGLNSRTVASSVDEVPFWNETIPEASGGRITATFQPLDLMGLEDSTILRLTKLGVMDFASMDISKMAGDDPVFEGCDLAGLTLDIDAARAACEAWKPVMAEAMAENWNTKLLALGTNPPQVIWCRDQIQGLGDLRGKKVRVFNKTMNDFINAVGGTTVSLPFAEVVPALQRGVVDCAVTGSLSGNTAGWPEVTDYLYPMIMGWSINYQSANLDSWNRFPPEVQDFFLEQFDQFEDKMWQTAKQATEEAENCNVGEDPCTLGEKVDMTLVPVSEEDKELHKQLMQDTVLVEWAKRCGRECAERWNGTVGEVVGLQIPLDKI
jgi:TRAP-type transport system periplasmic protein